MSDTPALLNGIGLAMRHLSERQRTIAQNIANSETPGYKARDVEAPDFGALVASQSGSEVHVPRPHVRLSEGMAAMGARAPENGATMLDQHTSETKPDGNNVTIEDQLLKMAQVQADFTALTNLYRKQMSLLKTATGRGGV
ncbi:flagellar basal body protein [Iodidimonas sp. SYSU 1G8]|uniref:flagellar basal body protein n=1 Tax=Iodidimonas sp. SYSU 1G8 TaxID=3133967 RepID=UPI0031FF1BE5